MTCGIIGHAKVVARAPNRAFWRWHHVCDVSIFISPLPNVLSLPNTSIWHWNCWGNIHNSQSRTGRVTNKMLYIFSQKHKYNFIVILARISPVFVVLYFNFYYTSNTGQQVEDFDNPPCLFFCFSHVWLRVSVSSLVWGIFTCGVLLPVLKII